MVAVRLQMTNHTLVPQAEALEGRWQASFHKLYGLLQDSGWRLTPEGEEGDAELDDVPALGQY